MRQIQVIGLGRGDQSRRRAARNSSTGLACSNRASARPIRRHRECAQVRTSHLYSRGSGEARPVALRASARIAATGLLLSAMYMARLHALTQPVCRMRPPREVNRFTHPLSRNLRAMRRSPAQTSFGANPGYRAGAKPGRVSYGRNTFARFVTETHAWRAEPGQPELAHWWRVHSDAAIPLAAEPVASDQCGGGAGGVWAVGRLTAGTRTSAGPMPFAVTWLTPNRASPVLSAWRASTGDGATAKSRGRLIAFKTAHSNAFRRTTPQDA